MKKELAVAALRNGTVIDHLPVSSVFRIAALIGLSQADSVITIANNLPSSRLGRKGIIKIADREFSQDELNRIALLAPSAVINTIRDYEVVNKEQVVMPDEVVGIIECPNPKCITRNEPMASRFHTLSAADGPVLRCHYCDHETRPE